MHVDTTARTHRRRRRNSIGCSRRRSPASSILPPIRYALLQPRHAPLRSRVDGPHARARRRRVACLRRHGAHRDAAAAASAVSRRGAHSDARVSGRSGRCSRSRRCRRSRSRAPLGETPDDRSVARAVTPTRRSGEGRGEVARRLRRCVASYTAALARATHARARELHATRSDWPARFGAAACPPASRLDAERFLRELDEAAFAAGGALPADAAERAERLYRAVDDEALPRTQIFTRVLSIVVVAALGVATAHALDSGQRSATRVRRGRRGIRAPRLRRGARVVHRVGAGRAARAGRVGESRHGVVGRRRHGAKRRGVAARASPRAARPGRPRARRAGALAAVDGERIRPAAPGRVGVHRGRASCGSRRGAGPPRVPARGGVVRRTRLASLGVAAGIVVLCGFALDRTRRRPTPRRAAHHGVAQLRSASSAASEGRRRSSAKSCARPADRARGRASASTTGATAGSRRASLISLDTRDASQIAQLTRPRGAPVALRRDRRFSSAHRRPAERRRRSDRRGRGRRTPGVGRERADRERARRRRATRSTSRSRTAAGRRFASATTARGMIARRRRARRSSGTPRRRFGRRGTSSACAASGFAARRWPRFARCRSSSSRPRPTTAPERSCAPPADESSTSTRPAVAAARPCASSRLFYNAPARLKFLRGARSEWRAILDVVGDDGAHAPRRAHLAVARRTSRCSSLPASADARAIGSPRSTAARSPNVCSTSTT